MKASGKARLKRVIRIGGAPGFGFGAGGEVPHLDDLGVECLDSLGLFALSLRFKASGCGVGVRAGLGGLGVPLADGLAVERVEGERPDPRRHHPGRAEQADRIENAVKAVLAQGLRTGDIYEAGTTKVGTEQMGDAVVKALA